MSDVPTTPELIEFEGENVGDLITNLLAEVKRLRRDIEGYIEVWDWIDPKGYYGEDDGFMEILYKYGFAEKFVEDEEE